MKQIPSLLFIVSTILLFTGIIKAQIPISSVFAYEDGVTFHDGKKYVYMTESEVGGNHDDYYPTVFDGGLRIIAIVKLGNEYITAFEDGTIYRGSHTKGLRDTKLYKGQKIDAMIGYKGGILTAFEQGGIIWSPDANNPGGTGKSVKLQPVKGQTKPQRVLAMIVHKGGIVYAFEGGSVIWSPNGSYPGGKSGFTQTLYKGQKVTAMMPYKSENGFLIAYEQGGVFWTPDGKNVAAKIGGTQKLITKKVYSFTPFEEGFVTIFMDKENNVKYTPDGKNIGGKGDTKYLYYVREKPNPNPNPVDKAIYHVRVIGEGPSRIHAKSIKNFSDTKTICLRYKVCTHSVDCGSPRTICLKPGEKDFITDAWNQDVLILNANY